MPRGIYTRMPGTATYRHLGPAEREAIKGLRLAGYTIAELAAMFQCCTSTIENITLNRHPNQSRLRRQQEQINAG